MRVARDDLFSRLHDVICISLLPEPDQAVGTSVMVRLHDARVSIRRRGNPLGIGYAASTYLYTICIDDRVIRLIAIWGDGARKGNVRLELLSEPTPSIQEAVGTWLSLMDQAQAA